MNIVISCFQFLQLFPNARDDMTCRSGFFCQLSDVRFQLLDPLVRFLQLVQTGLVFSDGNKSIIPCSRRCISTNASPDLGSWNDLLRLNIVPSQILPFRSYPFLYRIPLGRRPVRVQYPRQVRRLSITNIQLHTPRGHSYPVLCCEQRSPIPHKCKVLPEINV